MDYIDFLRSKELKADRVGMESVPELSGHLFPHQRDVTAFLLGVGRGAAFLDTGLGKTAVELEWARIVMEHTNKPVLFFAPLAVGLQHAREAARFGVDVSIAKDQSDIKGAGIYITNYERLNKFDRNEFAAIVLDESSIVKSFNGKISNGLVAFANDMRWRLAATATPAPNDHMELGQHSQFLGAMPSNEMLARFFIADQSQMGKYRIKRHGIKAFWSWVASWARCVGNPSDLGHDGSAYVLPEIEEHIHCIAVDPTIGREDGELIRKTDTSATSIHREKRITSTARAEKIAEIVRAEPDEAWMIWVETDYDAQSIMALLPDAVEVSGKMSSEVKEERLNGFTTGDIKILVSKPSIAGYGLNWQHCARTAFVGLSFSYEMYYQAIRRFHRFGQKRQVHAHIAMADTEMAIWSTIKRKMEEHEDMKREMFEAMRRESLSYSIKHPYQPTKKAELPSWLKESR
jgi:superfamily II DNA or RNA helicase